MEVSASSLASSLARLVMLLGVVCAAAGCEVGEYGTSTASMTPDATMTTTTSSNGETSFNAMVKPLVGTCLGCHSGGQQPTLTSFTTLQAKYKMKPGSTNILVTKGDHAGIQYLNAADKDKVKAWIDSL